MYVCYIVNGMAKVNKTYSITQEVVHELAIRNIKNVSGLIEDLLKSYLQIQEKEVDVAEKELKGQLMDKKAELAKLEQRLAYFEKKRQEAADLLQKQIENGEVYILE
jgi:flagellar motility protein MotE (MotC chaperone)